MANKITPRNLEPTSALEKTLRSIVDTDTPGTVKLGVDGDTVSMGGAVVTSAIQDVAVGGTTTAALLGKAIIRAGADAVGDILTIADGTVGQQLIVILDDATGTLTITPATFNGGTSITMDAIGDAVTLTFIGTLGWTITGGNSYTII